MAEGTCCSVQNCARPVVARSWCAAHYTRWTTHGDVFADRPLRAKRQPEPPGPCECPGCDRPRFAKGFCAAHYERWRSYGPDMDVGPISPIVRLGTCEQRTCDNHARSRGLCSMHYSRLLRHGSATAQLRPELTAELLAARANGLRQYQREWKRRQYAANAEAMRRRAIEWRRNNPERSKLHDAKNRHRRRAAPKVPFTVDQLAQKIAYWGGKCWVCRAPYEQIDHVKPLSKGGWHVLANLRPICAPCNGGKHDRWPYS